MTIFTWPTKSAALWLVLVWSCSLGWGQSAGSSSLQTSQTQARSKETESIANPHPIVQLEEAVYEYTAADNGAGPMWCSGSTCLVRMGDQLYASGLETLKDVPPLNNCRWLLFHRGPQGWELRQADDLGRTREPSPLAVFQDGRLFLSANPTLVEKPQPGGGPARPELWQFSDLDANVPPKIIKPNWRGQPEFTEHSYRSLAADGPKGELILFQNIGYTHAEWAFQNQHGNWAAQGQLKWPYGAEYDHPQPIRVCYPNVALHNHAVHFCGVSDIVEPYQRFRDYKRQLTGKEWDYDFRRLFYTWTPDIRTGEFREWTEIASRDQTCGWISPGDLWVAPDGTVHLLWMERALDERLREKFFPEAKQHHAMNYAILRDGKVVIRRTLMEAVEGESRLIPSAGRFHVTPEGRLFVFFYVSGIGDDGQSVSENRLMEVRPEGRPGWQASVPLQRPFVSYFTATPRAGCAPSRFLEILGQQAGRSQTISYAKIGGF